MKKLFCVLLSFIVIAGCGKKPKTAQKPQVPASETSIVSSIEKTQVKTLTGQLYPEKEKKQVKTPEWVEKLISIYDKNYDTWREKSSSDSSSVLIASLVSSGVAPSTPSSGPSGSPAPVLRPPVSSEGSAIASSTPSRPSPFASGPSALSGVSVVSAGSTAPVTPPSSSPDTAPPPPSPDTPPIQPQPAQNIGVTVVRSIQNISGGAYVRLNVSVTDAKVSGIIVSENIPEGYMLVTSTPAVSKRIGNTVKWLFYGTSLTDQTINYEIKGSGKAAISGSYSSTFGSGNTTGESQVGQ